MTTTRAVELERRLDEALDRAMVSPENQ